jgi:hypothetical protein
MREVTEQRTLLALVLLTAVILPLLTARTDKPGEFYPFSNFPMYSSFDEETYYVYLTDLQDKPLNVAELFGTPLSNVKKSYDGRLMQLKKETGSKLLKAQLPTPLKEQAAQETLSLIVKNAPLAQRARIATLSGLRLHQVDLRLSQGRIVKESHPLTEAAFHRPAPAPAQP